MQHSELGVSEAELLATRCGERSDPTPFQTIQKILLQIESLGKVMALTRNDAVVHERKGTYLNPYLDDAHMGMFVGEDIDLRIFFKHWGSVFAVENETRRERAFAAFSFLPKTGKPSIKSF